MAHRILHIIDSFTRGGTAKQVLLLSEGLTKRGFDVHVAALGARGAMRSEFVAVGIATTEIGRRWVVDPLGDWRLWRLVKQLRPDVVHTWDSVAGQLGAIAARRGGRPRLVAGTYRIDRWQRPWEEFWEHRFRTRVDRFVTNSAAVRDWCVQQGMPCEKLAVIEAGVPSATASDVAREELLRELRLPSDARLIGVVGRLAPEKRVQDLIWAADLLRVLHNNLRLLVIGDGPLRGQLERYARLASDLEHIQFLGERANVWRIVPHLDVLWNGSENVGQSMAILEAMAAGVPVIASDVPVNRELVVEGETGYLIPIGSRAGRAARARYTDRIVTDAALAERLAAAANRRIAEHFGTERMVQQHVDLYSKSTP